MLKGKSQDVVYRWREAEITHGRVGMLAAAGFLVQEKCASNPICMHHSAQMSSSMRGIPIAYRFHPLFSGVGGPAIKQIPQLPPAIWFCMTMGIAFTEALRIQKGWANPYESSDNLQRLKPGYYPGGGELTTSAQLAGDLGWDPLGIKPEDPMRFRRMQECELSHGRLAMLAAAGFMAQEAVSGTTWSAYSDLFKFLRPSDFYNF
eukprot:scaffold43532_cov34-Tisochrysis_lutea.AAC.2